MLEDATAYRQVTTSWRNLNRDSVVLPVPEINWKFVGGPLVHTLVIQLFNKNLFDFPSISILQDIAARPS
jgi:hypothetical protein